MKLDNLKIFLHKIEEKFKRDDECKIYIREVSKGYICEITTDYPIFIPAKFDTDGYCYILREALEQASTVYFCSTHENKNLIRFKFLIESE